LKEHKEELLTQLRQGKYKRQLVLRVEISKQDGGKRKLGIPTVIDRMLQQAINQVLQLNLNQRSSITVLGFVQNVVRIMPSYGQNRTTNKGTNMLVDLAMKSYFDTVNHRTVV
jgi:RNA-directed DNA polymerase